MLSSQNDTQATSFTWATWHWKGAKELLHTQEHTVDSQFLWRGGLPGDSLQGPSERLLDHSDFSPALVSEEQGLPDATQTYQLAIVPLSSSSLPSLSRKGYQIPIT